MKQLVLIPVYNEESSVEKVVAEIQRYYSGDIVAVDDGSTDRSAEILSNLQGITLINHDVNSGYGQSLIDGFRYAVNGGYDVLVTIDCDEQHEPYHIPEIFRGIGSCDVFSASRYLTNDEHDDAPPEDRFRINRHITAMINKLTGWNLTDGFCGLKGYRVDKLAKMDLKVQGYAFPIEFWVQALHLGLCVKEFPIERVYKNLGRTFGGGIDNPVERLRYYEEVLESEAKRWHISLPWEPTRTT